MLAVAVAVVHQAEECLVELAVMVAVVLGQQQMLRLALLALQTQVVVLVVLLVVLIHHLVTVAQV
jgi:hypothetical protein